MLARMFIKGPVRVSAVARPVRYPEEVEVEFHFLEPVAGVPPGKGILQAPCTVEQMWDRFRPVHIDDRARVEEILAVGDGANLGEVLLSDFEIEDEDLH